MNQAVNIDIPEPVETLFDAKRDGMPEIISVNKSLLGFAHPDIFPWHLCITLEARELIDNGMPSPDESALLFRLGDEIEAVVLGGRTSFDAANALFLARSTWDGVRELYYRVHDPEVAHQALQIALTQQQWEREWNYRMECDESWEKAGYIFQLFPRAQGCND